MFPQKKKHSGIPVQNVMHCVDRTEEGGPGQRRHTASHLMGESNSIGGLDLERELGELRHNSFAKRHGGRYLPPVGCAGGCKGLVGKLAGALHGDWRARSGLSVCAWCTEREGLSDLPFCSPMSIHSTEERLYLVDGHWKAGGWDGKCML